MVSFGQEKVYLYIQTTLQNNKQKRRECIFQTRRVQRQMILKNPPETAGGHHLSPLLQQRRRGSATVEAALALPLFLIVCMMLLSMIDMTRTYMREEEKLYEQTRKAAVYGAIGSAAVKSSGDDTVEFYKPYTVMPAIQGLGFRRFLVVNHCKAHIWNGYDNSAAFLAKDDPEYVYVTEQGSVYHRKRSCQFLNVTVRSVSAGQVGAQRSEDGSKYYPCPKCTRGLTKKELPQYTLYVASYGTRYHIRLTCPNLKRTVYVVPYSQVKGKPACSECGGE